MYAGRRQRARGPAGAARAGGRAGRYDRRGARRADARARRRAARPRLLRGRASSSRTVSPDAAHRRGRRDDRVEPGAATSASCSPAIRCRPAIGAGARADSRRSGRSTRICSRTPAATSSSTSRAQGYRAAPGAPYARGEQAGALILTFTVTRGPAAPRWARSSWPATAGAAAADLEPLLQLQARRAVRRCARGAPWPRPSPSSTACAASPTCASRPAIQVAAAERRDAACRPARRRALRHRRGARTTVGGVRRRRRRHAGAGQALLDGAGADRRQALLPAAARASIATRSSARYRQPGLPDRVGHVAATLGDEQPRRGRSRVTIARRAADPASTTSSSSATTRTNADAHSRAS